MYNVFINKTRDWKGIMVRLVTSRGRNANNLFCQRASAAFPLFFLFFLFFFHPLIFHPLFAIGGPGPGPRCHLVLHWAFIPALISNIFTQERDGPQWRSGCSGAAWNRCTLSVGPGLVAGRVGGAADCAIFWVVGAVKNKLNVHSICVARVLGC